MSLSYKILLKPEPESGYTVNVPALPGCITYGIDLGKAKINAKEAIELYIESLKEHRENLGNNLFTKTYEVFKIW